MASNFQVSVDHNSKTLQLKLSGDFDGSSAFQLLSFLRNCIKETEKIIIHTDSIKYIEPFGLNVFRYNLGSLVKHSAKLVFMGENAFPLIEAWPENSRPQFQMKHKFSNIHKNRGVDNSLFY